MATADRGQQDVGRKVWNRIDSRREELGLNVSGEHGIDARLGTYRGTWYVWKKKLLTGRKVEAGVLANLEQALQLPYGELLRLYGLPAPALPGSTSPISIAIVNADELEQPEKEALLRVYESFMAAKRRSVPSPE